MPITPPVMAPDDHIAGVSRNTDIGGYEYAGGINPALIGQQQPYPSDPSTQGISFDPLWTFDLPAPTVNNQEGPAAQYFNGGVTQAVVDMGQNPHYVSNDVDEIESAWNSGNTNMSPYQVDTNMIGPATGNSEDMLGNTLQPDYNPQGQYGASTGGGTSYHETTTAYYISQSDQVQRDYSVSALFASI